MHHTIQAKNWGLLRDEARLCRKLLGTLLPTSCSPTSGNVNSTARRLHHRELHRYGDEASWWAAISLDPIPIALSLWKRSGADRTQVLEAGFSQPTVAEAGAAAASDALAATAALGDRVIDRQILDRRCARIGEQAAEGAGAVKGVARSLEAIRMRGNRCSQSQPDPVLHVRRH